MLLFMDVQGKAALQSAVFVQDGLVHPFHKAFDHFGRMENKLGRDLLVGSLLE
jgi:hypothetical protein